MFLVYFHAKCDVAFGVEDTRAANCSCQARLVLVTVVYHVIGDYLLSESRWRAAEASVLKTPRSVVPLRWFSNSVGEMF